MKAMIQLKSESFLVDLSRPIDISLRMGKDRAGAWYLGKPIIEPVKNGDWIGKVSEGASVNFNEIKFSPHAHGTHTESYGHISKEFYGISDALDTFFFKAKLISVQPEQKGEDQVITKDGIAAQLGNDEVEALVIRSLPNPVTKRDKDYDHDNWPYLSPETAAYLREMGVLHLLIDLPSVDREEGDVLAHCAFWDYPNHPRKNATLTEMIYVPDSVKDGIYLLNLQVANFENDAAPSRPVLYELLKEQ